MEFDVERKIFFPAAMLSGEVWHCEGRSNISVLIAAAPFESEALNVKRTASNDPVRNNVLNVRFMD